MTSDKRRDIIMRTSLRSTFLALALGLASFGTISVAHADPPWTRTAPARNDFRPADNGRFDNDRIDDRLRDIDRQRAELDSREQNLRAQLQNANYYGQYQYVDRDRIFAEFRDIHQREDQLNAERNNLLAQRADFERPNDNQRRNDHQQTNDREQANDRQRQDGQRDRGRDGR